MKSTQEIVVAEVGYEYPCLLSFPGSCIVLMESVGKGTVVKQGTTGNKLGSYMVGWRMSESTLSNLRITLEN